MCVSRSSRLYTCIFVRVFFPFFRLTNAFSNCGKPYLGANEALGGKPAPAEQRIRALIALRAEEDDLLREPCGYGHGPFVGFGVVVRCGAGGGPFFSVDLGTAHVVTYCCCATDGE